MSGGVDSAVALLRAGPDAIGVTLRLWLDPQGPDADRACCSPEAVIAARATCHRLGIPHVTLDLREEFRRAVVEPFVRGYAARRDPEPVHPLQRQLPLRRVARLRRPSGAERAGDRPLRTDRRARGRLLLARATDERKDQSYMLARLDPRFLDRLWFPLGEQGKDETRAEAARAGLAVGAASGEPGGVLPRRRRLPGLPRAPRPGCRRKGRSWTRTERELGRHAGSWRFTPGQRSGLGVSAPEPLYALRSEAATNTVVVGPRAALAIARRARPGAAARPGRAGRGQAPVPLARRRAGRRPGRRRLPARARPSPRTGWRPGQAAVLYDDGVVVGAGTIVERRNRAPSFRVLERRAILTGDEIILTIPRERAVLRGRTPRARRRRGAARPDVREPRRPRDQRWTPCSSGPRRTAT